MIGKTMKTNFSTPVVLKTSFNAFSIFLFRGHFWLHKGFADMRGFKKML